MGQALATAGGAASSSSISSIAAIDGIDFSPAMLAMARKTGVYRNLIRGDLTARIHVVADAGMILWSAWASSPSAMLARTRR